LVLPKPCDVTELGPMTQKALGDALRIDRTTMVDT
jgi:hypothetical protein